MKKQLIHIKGTKDGLVLRLDDQCSFTELVEELGKKVTDGHLDGKIDVQLHLGKRYCTQEQKDQLTEIVERQQKLCVKKIQSDVITLEESHKLLETSRFETYVGIVRSGQTIRVTGDILVLGDVNPNGRIEAGGNVHIAGKLKGIVHAGMDGNEQAIVSASHFEPTHILIGNYVEVMTNESQYILDNTDQIFAYLGENNVIAYDRIQEIRNVRPNLSTFKGGS
ncbi:septum site-determining protein MinC [Solibacillus sp. FSL W7-1472]|uniref:Probable septum site-determining protein MinC n=1 Tax=Solibacillus silvestris (strain StLB046) TaxID=1002809 RepID=F2F3D6_SOLSS|nr:septum site-determining protein MinC [Solibacillus silvestris]OBW59871.1 septum site-determining protein MinC [Solibacillus silvestris]BAK15884.1 septum formation inhibitor [Solibacillus silvestris StLB046]